MSNQGDTQQDIFGEHVQSGGALGPLPEPSILDLGGDQPAVQPMSVRPKNKLVTGTDLSNIQFCIGLQSLLAQFSHHRVRSDFSRGCSAGTIDPQLLNSIDDLRWTIFPLYRVGGFSTENSVNSNAAFHLDKLMKKSDQIFVTNVKSPESCLSYHDWHGLLNMIAKDNYWREVSTRERCLNVLSNNTSSIPATNNNKLSQREKDVTSQSSFDAKLSPKGRKRNPSKKVQKIVTLSSDESTASSTTSDDDTSSDAKSPVRSRRKRHNKAIEKEVVKPPAFELSGKTSLEKQFLAFERYFDARFTGSSRDKTQKLGEFLEGKLLKVYNVKGGRKLRYTNMKEELLSYYKKKKVGGRRYWRKQLSCAFPEDDEGYDIFGMRLLELAELAYPNDKKECALQLRQQFLDAIPSHIAATILDGERNLKASTSGRKKHFTFEDIAEMAADIQERNPKSRQVNWSQPAPPQLAGAGEGMLNCEPVITRTFSNSRFSRKPVQTPRGSACQGCGFCGHPNHERVNCWRELGLCGICGADHELSACPRFIPNYRSRSSSGGNRQHRQESLN